MKKALGKGLSALIPDTYKQEETIKDDTTPVPEARQTSSGGDARTGFQLISMQEIIPNTQQPRKEFHAEGIDELAASIKEKGVLQPVIVKKMREHAYVLVCGERRFRAAKLCGLTSVPAIVKDIATEDLLEWALIENIQREDLSPIEEAEAYRKLAEERMLSQEEIAKRVGKDRSTVANMIRLTRLPEEVKQYLDSGRLTAGHARTILGLMTPEHQRQMAKKIVEENLSVRQVENIVNRSNAQKRRAKKARHLAPEIIDLETRLSQHLGTQAKILPRKNQKEGRLEIHYYSLDDLDRILSSLGLAKV